MATLITQDDGHGHGNASACQVCGDLPPDIFRRSQSARNSGARYLRHRTNRIRLPDPEQHHGFCRQALRLTIPPGFVGLLACANCYARFVTRQMEWAGSQTGTADEGNVQSLHAEADHA